MKALIETSKPGLFQFKILFPNILAGFIVGIIALPLSMAFAIASGAKPEQGIYTAIIAGFIVGIFGGSRFQIAGPTGAFVVVLLGITAKYGIEGLQIATLMAGIILLFLGIMRLGSIIKFIPDPVIVGFTSGVALIIFVTEWKDFFGLHHIPSNLTYFHEKFLVIISALPDISLSTTTLGSISLLILIASPKLMYTKNIPAPVIALMFAGLIQSIFQFSDVATIGSVYGEIPRELPEFTFPSFSLSQFIALIGPAFTIALLGAIESLLSAIVADGMTGTRHDSNQELIGQGLANIICPFFGGFAATGAIARTATSIRHGGSTRMAAIVHSVTLLVAIYFLAHLIKYIPLCTLAAILFVVAYNMSDMKHFYYVLRHAPKNDIFVLLTTFFLTIFTDLVVAVNVGVILAVLLFTQRMSQSVTIEQEKEEKIKEELAIFQLDSFPKNILVYSIQGPFFFAAAEKLEHLLSVIQDEPKVLIFRLKGVPFMDITGIQTFQEIIEDLNGRGIKVIICEANARVVKKLEKMEVLKFVYHSRTYDTLQEAIQSI
ncbi:MAG: STAS domain-containing protein [Alphaproteobacteria bacterium]|nr:STAS domain-containing protein [Alphaproteobacteria bacterium]